MARKDSLHVNIFHLGKLAFLHLDMNVKGFRSKDHKPTYLSDILVR